MCVIFMSYKLGDSRANTISERFLWDLIDHTLINISMEVLQDIVRFSACENIIAESYIGLCIEILLRVEAELIILRIS